MGQGTNLDVLVKEEFKGWYEALPLEKVWQPGRAGETAIPSCPKPYPPWQGTWLGLRQGLWGFRHMIKSDSVSECQQQCCGCRNLCLCVQLAQVCISVLPDSIPWLALAFLGMEIGQSGKGWSGQFLAQTQLPLKMLHAALFTIEMKTQRLRDLP